MGRKRESSKKFPSLFGLMREKIRAHPFSDQKKKERENDKNTVEIYNVTLQIFNVILIGEYGYQFGKWHYQSLSGIDFATPVEWHYQKSTQFSS